MKPTIGVRDGVIEEIGLLGAREVSRKGLGGRLYTEGLATTLAVQLLRRYGTSTRPSMIYKGGLALRILHRVIDYIDGHLQDELSLGELARIAGLSPHHFASAFKAATGASPHRYVVERRIDGARQLLRQEDKTISDVAYAVGFSSQSHFTANFHRVTGTTPRKFRQSLG